jgi:acyl dehydratase
MENEMAKEEVETVGLGFHWEDLPVGRKFKTVGRTVTETDLVNFITCTGMLEVLFTNIEFIEKESAIKGRVVPGALAYTFAEGLLTQSAMQGAGLAFLNMELDIKAPTFVGDTIHVECEVIGCQESKKRPGLGLVRTRNQVVKQDGTVVLVYTPLRLVKGKNYKAR